MAGNIRVRERFATLAAQTEDAVDLALGALLIAAEAYPELDTNAYLGKIDRLADAARPRVTGARADEAPLALLRFLHDERGFVGNAKEYYDPRNSYLNEVLERRKGIPITLVVLYVEVARRLGLRADGVGFPGHFLARSEIAGREIILDAFDGRQLSERDCAERLRQLFGPAARFDCAQLRPVTKKQILARMLGNLKRIHLRARALETALACCDRILLLAPDSPGELRDRGLLYERLECYRAAENDLERFLALAPDDESAEEVRRRLADIRRQATRIH